MAIPDLPDEQRIEAIRDEARRLAASGKQATWREVADACMEHGMTRDEVHHIFEDVAFRKEIEGLAEVAHGVGGRGTA
jgi:hypothetical protein